MKNGCCHPMLGFELGSESRSVISDVAVGAAERNSAAECFPVSIPQTSPRKSVTKM